MLGKRSLVLSDGVALMSGIGSGFCGSMQATSTPHANELDVRREQLSWRMWGVHYRKERVAYLNAKDSSWEKELAESQGPILHEHHEHIHDDYDDTTSGAYGDRPSYAVVSSLLRCWG